MNRNKLIAEMQELIAVRDRKILMENARAQAEAGFKALAQYSVREARKANQRMVRLRKYNPYKVEVA